MSGNILSQTHVGAMRAQPEADVDIYREALRCRELGWDLSHAIRVVTGNWRRYYTKEVTEIVREAYRGGNR